MGMFFALDDFGTGSSSISIRKLLRCTALKIDTNFVIGLVNDPKDYAIVQALTDLGHNMQRQSSPRVSKPEASVQS
ncbi:Phytochrome-like protein cph2 [Boseongicola aestuarii]|uniref:Phytochrome-like protein cph2 n=2 Tax=Boseongicola aestuarii TaxID=1470561 RepID=A0A238J3S7_9RHOB|nr:Phytochrome-like protein cph2 [Boseongicola aestuarii]